MNFQAAISVSYFKVQAILIIDLKIKSGRHQTSSHDSCHFNIFVAAQGFHF
jgi:hypothetical protein